MNVPAVQQPWELSAVGLRLKDPALTIEDFAALCSSLGEIYKIARFAVGDAIVQGEELFGAEAFQAFEQFQLSEDAMIEYSRVSRKVPIAVRHRDLSWSHHRAVAALEPPAQKEWLERAAVGGLSHAALREELRDGAAPLQANVCRCCHRPL